MEDVININVAVTTWLIFWTTYWIFGSLLTWKAHIDKIRPVTELNKVVSVLLVNMMWSLIGSLILCFLPFRALTDAHILIKILFTYAITDIWFYHTHIMLHQKQLYPLLHRFHHDFQKPYSLTALYATPYEVIVSGTFSGGLGTVICQLPPPYLYIWFFIVSVNSVATHSGYRLSYLIDGLHDYHHLSYHYNYGNSPWFDKLYGTYKDPDEIVVNIEKED